MKLMVKPIKLLLLLVTTMVFSSAGAEENIMRAPVKLEQKLFVNANLMTTTGKLFVRSGPGKNNRATAILKKGRSVTVLQERDGWYRIQFNKKEGWVSGKFLKK